MYKAITLVLLQFLAASTSLLQAEVNTTRSVSFGDSLTDNDYLFLIFDNDPFLYQADPFERMFQKAASQGDVLENYAVLGSESQHVLQQVRQYVSARSAGQLPPATLLSLEAGGNDFLNEAKLFQLANYPPGANEAADEIVNSIRQNLMQSVRLLRQVDDAPVVLWTIPDVTQVPVSYLYGFSPDQLSNLRLHVARINQFLRHQTKRKDLVLMDMAEVLNMATYSPPVIMEQIIYPAPLVGSPTYIFADPIHPTAVANGILANEMIQSLNKKLADDIPLYSEEELGTMAGIN